MRRATRATASADSTSRATGIGRSPSTTTAAADSTTWPCIGRGRAPSGFCDDSETGDQVNACIPRGHGTTTAGAIRRALSRRQTESTCRSGVPRCAASARPVGQLAGGDDHCRQLALAVPGDEYPAPAGRACSCSLLSSTKPPWTGASPVTCTPSCVTGWLTYPRTTCSSTRSRRGSRRRARRRRNRGGRRSRAAGESATLGCG